MRLFIISTPGLENLTAREMETTGLSGSPGKNQGLRIEPGGIEFEGTLSDLYRSNLLLRTASRVLVRLGSFFSAGFPEFRRKAANLPWEDYLKKDQPVSIRVTSHQSRLYHQRAVAERIAGALSDRLKHPVSLFLPNREDGTTPQLILVRLVQDQCTISLDSSGELLHRRGYRLESTKAPLRETLAAAMLLCSGWDGISPLIDPFCGSGTIPIEAALMARNIPPGFGRSFAFMTWPGFKRSLWNTILEETTRVHRALPFKIIGSDRDEGAIRAAKANAERAGIADAIEFLPRSISSIDPPQQSGWVVTNPPYGIRTRSGGDLRNLYAQLGNVLKSKCPGWHVTFLCSDPKLYRNAGIHFDEGISLLNGGIRVKMCNGVV